MKEKMKNKKVKEIQEIEIKDIKNYGSPQGESRKRFLEYINKEDKPMLGNQICRACGYSQETGYSMLPRLAAEGLITMTRRGPYYIYSKKKKEVRNG